MKQLLVLCGLLCALACAPQALAAAPTIVSAASVNGLATATWTLPADVEPLVIEVSLSQETNLDGSFASVESGSFLFGTQTTWTDSFSLEAGETYYVHVGATDMTCQTCPLVEYSNVVSFVATEGTDSNVLTTLRIKKDGTGDGAVTSNPAGIDCEPTCRRTYLRGIHVTLTPKPSPGSVFVGWSGGGCSGYAPTCEVILNVAQTVTATFDLVAPPSIPTLVVARDGTSATATFSVCDDSAGPMAISLIQVWQDKGQWKSTRTTITQNHAAGCDTHTVSGPIGAQAVPALWIAVQVTDVDGRQGSLRTAPAP
jgi:hypothetical protein